MNILLLFASGGFIIWELRNILFWTALWQLKEYRFDRVRIHLFETYQGKSLLFSYLSVLKWGTIFSYIIVVLNPSLQDVFVFLVTGIYIVEGLLVIREELSHTLKRPKFTGKASIILGLSLLIIGLLFIFPPVDKFLWLLLLDRFVVLLISFFIFILSFPSQLYKDYIVEKAMKKLAHYRAITMQHKPLLVIGITGSYGKSSTKEYVAQILEKKFTVLKTKGTNNTPIGIAKTILIGLKKDTQIFVAEMGAYKRREIAQMCSIVHPQIGILTAVNQQHLSLFGSLENTMQAKYELIDSLPKNGLALFNGNNENSKLLYKKEPEIYIEGLKRTKKKKILYQWFKNQHDANADISAFNVLSEKEGVTFDVFLNRKVMHLKTSLIGPHVVENILPGIYIASHLGMSNGEIKKAVQVLKPMQKTMARHTLANGVQIIDDTFNANPQAVLAAIQYVNVFKGKKILVLQPMIELGEKAEDEHYRVAHEISKTCDYLFLTNSNFYESTSQGIEEGRGKCILKVAKPLEIAQFIQRHGKRGDVIVFEGKEAAFSMDKIL